MKKTLAIITALMLLGVFLAADAGYAIKTVDKLADEGSETPAVAEEAAKRVDEAIPGKDDDKLASGHTLQLASRPNALDKAGEVNIIPTTAELLMESGAERNRIMGFIKEGYTICVATRDNSVEYINRVINAFVDPSMARGLIESDTIIFSLVTNNTLFAAIEGLAEKDLALRTLDRMTADQIEELKSGV
ncbi:MAG: hypothetical protein KKG01_02305 [Candidatus Omnitrophica bacterium]|nr:hypothetical protein [Candidatus Omnitrophota bacterium]